MTDTPPEHAEHLAHQFETPEQQFQSGKLGIWLFLGTEILLFSGLFCAYAVYRANHPEVFYYAHLYLSKPLGALNTMVLILSSFTMAAAVRAAQLGNTRWLVRLLAVTLVCGFRIPRRQVRRIQGQMARGAFDRRGLSPRGPAAGRDGSRCKAATGGRAAVRSRKRRRPLKNQRSPRPRLARKGFPSSG